MGGTNGKELYAVFSQALTYGKYYFFFIVLGKGRFELKPHPYLWSYITKYLYAHGRDVN